MFSGAWDSMKGLAKLGPAPAVVGVVAISAFAGMAAGANGFWVFLIVVSLLIAFLYHQERERAWARDDRKDEYNRILEGEGRDTLKRLSRRRDENAEKEQPTLFPEMKGRDND